jgi:hypothetical protein
VKLTPHGTRSATSRGSFEVIWDDRDHVMESRYRLEGQKPVLVESRGRDPAIGFQGMVLAVLTLVIWKTTKWVAQAQGCSKPAND